MLTDSPYKDSVGYSSDLTYVFIHIEFRLARRYLNNNSRNIDDIFTIDDPEFEKRFPDIYPTKFQLNKANASGKETSFLYLNITVSIPALTHY